MKHLIMIFLVLAVSGPTLRADLISIGLVPDSGSGLGSLNTLLTFTSQGSATTESGCVSAGAGGTTLTGPGSCPGSGPNGGPAFTGGDEQAQNSVFLASSLGITDFNNIQIIFNASEPQGGAQGITLTNLAVTLWDGNGGILDAKYIANSEFFPDTSPGVGNAGFGFVLDPLQANDFNLILAAQPDVYIGVAANAIDATGGLETISIRTAIRDPGDPVIPEPTTLVLVAAGLCGMKLVLRKKRTV